VPNITVNQLPNIGGVEDHTHEFKRSIFVDPVTQAPGVKQMVGIARSLAAFMNADGGELLLSTSTTRTTSSISFSRISPSPLTA